MPGFFSKVFRAKDGPSTSPKAKRNAAPYQTQTPLAPLKPRWEDAWERKEVEPEEVQTLLRASTTELKSRALDMPFLLLPFRPASDPSAARSFIRSHFEAAAEGGVELQEQRLQHELRLVEPIVLCSVMKWCWSRLPGGIVTWEAYELFRVGEQDSQFARDSFATFVPISVESDARTKIIFDFFDLLAAIAAHGKNNGLGGRKLSRLAGWWAFEHTGTEDGFDNGYKSWMRAADATSHLFFAYLRSLSPDSVQGINGISSLPISLQALVQGTEYPPETPSLMQRTTAKVVMIVNSVSPGPFALLRRAKHFEYRDDDVALQSFADAEDPVDTLTEECRRVLKCIASANQSQASDAKASTSMRNGSWSRFEDIGFSSFPDESDREGHSASADRQRPKGLSSTSHSRRNDFARPTTPSWADFLSTGFADEPGTKGPAPLLLPPDAVLPPLETSRAKSSQSHMNRGDSVADLEPGELASIQKMSLDDAFWWVWITSLAGEEPNERKAVFGRCAVIETSVAGGSWLIMEEKVRGTVATPDEGAYLVEKKSRFGLTKRSRQPKKVPKKEPLSHPPPYSKAGTQSVPVSKTNIGPDQHARIQAAAAALQERQKLQQDEESMGVATRRGRHDDAYSTRTNSVMTLQPQVMSEAGPAMKWANKFDKDAIREAYLSDNKAGRGQEPSLEQVANGMANGGAPLATPPAPVQAPVSAAPASAPALNFNPGRSQPQSDMDRSLPALPQERGAVVEPTRPSAPTPPAKTPTPPPAPLPPTNAETQQAPAAPSADAAAVPLPVEHAAPVERQSPPVSQQSKALPAEPTPVPQTKVPEPAAVRLDSATSTPDKKARGGKLQKKKGGGLKAVFGRKKNQQREETQPPTVQQTQSAQEPGLRRRFSSFRNKGSPSPAAPASMPVPAAPAMEVNVPHAKGSFADSATSLTPPSSSPVPQDVPTREAPEPMMTREQEPLDISRTNTHDERQAHHAFSSFDQGPLEDSPAFAPDDASEHDGRAPSYTPSSPEEAHHHQPLAAEHERGVSPMTNHTDPTDSHAESYPADANDLDNHGSLDLTRDTSPQDRWAQIRKNAAERAVGTRPSEEISRPRTDDEADVEGEAEGETSGEETIESRVARIKARVAELTGNMDSKASPASGGKTAGGGRPSPGAEAGLGSSGGKVARQVKEFQG